MKAIPLISKAYDCFAIQLLSNCFQMIPPQVKFGETMIVDKILANI